MARQQSLQQVYGPTFQSLRQHSVVGIGTRLNCDLPSLNRKHYEDLCEQKVSGIEVMDKYKIKDGLVWQTFHALISVFVGVYFLRCEATKNINTKTETAHH